VLTPFIQGLFDPLTPAEKEFVDLFRYREGKYYIIGAQDDGDTLDHEECHALYYVNDEYRKQVDQILASEAFDVSHVEKQIKRMMYHPSVIMDEVHAYISTGDRGWFKEHSLEFPEKAHKRLRAAKEKHFKRS
jgi:hypothetical protein